MGEHGRSDNMKVNIHIENTLISVQQLLPCVDVASGQLSSVTYITETSPYKSDPRFPPNI